MHWETNTKLLGQGNNNSKKKMCIARQICTIHVPVQRYYVRFFCHGPTALQYLKFGRHLDTTKVSEAQYTPLSMVCLSGNTLFSLLHDVLYGTPCVLSVQYSRLYSSIFLREEGRESHKGTRTVCNTIRGGNGEVPYRIVRSRHASTFILPKTSLSCTVCCIVHPVPCGACNKSCM